MNQLITRRAVAGLFVLLALGCDLVVGAESRDLELHVGERTNVETRDRKWFKVADPKTVEADATDRHSLGLTGRAEGRTTVTVQLPDEQIIYQVKVSPAPEPAPVRPAEEAHGGRPGVEPPYSARPVVGLAVYAQTRRPQVFPDEVCALTLLCHNRGPETEADVTAEVRMPGEAEVVVKDLPDRVGFDPAFRRLSWHIPVIKADEQLTCDVPVHIVARELGSQLVFTPTVRSPRLTEPRDGVGVAVTVAEAPLLAVWALPDGLPARQTVPFDLHDLDPALRGEVRRLAALGLLQPSDLAPFRPDAVVGRADFVRMLVLAGRLDRLRDRVTIGLALSRPAKVSIAVADNLGRLVRTVMDGWDLPKGSHYVPWDGCDPGGQPVAMGIYRYTVTVTDESGLSQTLDGSLHVAALPEAPTSRGILAFRDVPPESKPYRWLAAGEAMGLVKDSPEGLFRPDEPVLRAEALAFAVRLLPSATVGETTTALGYSDETELPGWARGAVQIAAARGLVEAAGLVGADRRLEPLQPLSLRQATGLLDRLLDLVTADDLPVSGRVARGRSLLLDGHAAELGEGGRFREELTLSGRDPAPLIRAE